MAWRIPGGQAWERSKGAPNKRRFKKLVTNGEAHGCLALRGDEPVGWCCVGPRTDFTRLLRSRVLQTTNDETTWAVTCFFIPLRWRGRGVAGRLIRGATDLARRRGAHVLEGYPVKPYRSAGSLIPAAFAWTGVPSLFEKAGFKNVTPPGDGRPIYRRVFV